MAERHTPGPWYWEIDEDTTEVAKLIGPNDEEVCHFGETYWPTEGKAPSQADRRLIAAAPELLAALRMLRSYVTPTPLTNLAYDPWRKIQDEINVGISAADHAIARATLP